MRGGLTIQVGREFRVSQRREGLGDLRRFDVVVVDEEPLEERLVPLAPQVPGRGQVGVLAVGQQVERLAQRVLDVGEGCLGDFELPLGLVGLGGQPVLLLTQQVDWHRPRVVGVKELLALLGQPGDAAALAGGFGLGLRSHSGESLVHLLPHRLCLLVWHPNLAIGALHRRLDQVDGHVGLFAARALHPPDAEEIGVATAVAVCLDQAHSRAAAPAVERALQVVVVLSVLLGGVVVGGEDSPGLGKGGGVDQVLVTALVFDPGVADGAHVVGVLEQGDEQRA